MGVAFRSKESIEEKLRNEFKKVQRYLKDERKKDKGTGGGEYCITKLKQYLLPLADALAEKHSASGIPGIDDGSGDERPPEADDSSHLSDVEMQNEQEDDVTTNAGPSRECPGSSQSAAPARSRSAAAAARKTLSIFSDKRSQLYEEEIKLARLKQRKIQLEIEVAELKKEEAKLLVDAAKARAHVVTPAPISPAPPPHPSIPNSPSTFDYVNYYNYNMQSKVGEVYHVSKVFVQTASEI